MSVFLCLWIGGAIATFVVRRMWHVSSPWIGIPILATLTLLFWPVPFFVFVDQHESQP